MDERYHEELNKAANTLCEFCDNDDCRSCRVTLLMDYAEGLYQHDLKNPCDKGGK